LNLDTPSYFLSIIIPAYNEAEILAATVQSIIDEIKEGSGDDYEFIICENGSQDQTLEIAISLTKHWSQVVVESLPAANYGNALRHGILCAKGEIIVIFNADFWDIGFLHESIRKIEDYDFTIGSKNLDRQSDRRAWNRRWITILFNFLLKLLFGYPGSDTHGIKAIRAEAARELVRECRTSGELFDTEMVLRAHQKGLRILEIPVQVAELRPSRYGLLRRVPKTLRDLWILYYYLKIKK
jgi:glycosyltransferase involved in cell wall biosynthesis